MSAHAVDQVEARIAELVTARRAELLQLVDQALDRQLAELVDERIAKRNGAATRTTVPGPSAKLCADCGERPAAPGRTVCNSCRERERKRRRAQPADDDNGPRPSSSPTA